MNLNKYAKAIVGALVAGLAVLQTAMADDNMTNNEWIAVAAAVVGALGLVWAVPNSNGAATTPTLGGDPYTPPLVVEGGMGPGLLDTTDDELEDFDPEDITLEEEPTEDAEGSPEATPTA